MFGFKKRSSATQPDKSGSWWQALTKTRVQFSNHLARLLRGKAKLSSEDATELETLMLSADMGVTTCEQLITELKASLAKRVAGDEGDVLSHLADLMVARLQPFERVLACNDTPTVMLVVGVNGVGKTTSIAKLAHYFISQGQQVMLAAGDTYRAAAIEQLSVWGDRNQVPVVAQQAGADSAAVIFDAVASAKAKSLDVLIADTAGRLHTQDHLMSELKKIHRVVGKQAAGAPHEVLMVIDAGTGQNALQQVLAFHEALGVTGLIVTKLDGTARAGMLFAIVEQTQLPICFIGTGEQLKDLRPFSATEFVAALLSEGDIT